MATKIKLIVGLGNPGAQYANTRHNAGWMVVDKLGELFGANYWKEEYGALVAHIKCSGLALRSRFEKGICFPASDEELMLAKPQSYMNCSGGPVSKIAAAYGIKPEEILVVHDEMDIPAGDVRVKVGGGHGGHNGLRSLHEKLESNAYLRVRVGMGHPSGRKSTSDYVLSAPKGEEAELMQLSIVRAADAVECVLDEGPAIAQNRFNVKSE